MGTRSLPGFQLQHILPVKPLHNNSYGQAQVVSFSSHPSQQLVLKHSNHHSPQTLVDFLELYQGCNKDLVVELVGQRHQNSMFCNDRLTIEGLFEYIDWTLKDEIEYKRQSHKPFREDQAIFLMESLLESVKEVAQNKINFAYLDPEMVLLTSDRKYKVGLVGMLFEDKITMHRAFVPPEQGNIDYEKYRVYILGVILLQSLTLMITQELQEALGSTLKKHINKINCSNILKRLLLQMLDHNPLNRPNYPSLLSEVQQAKELLLNPRLHSPARKATKTLPSTSSHSKTLATQCPLDSKSLLKHRAKREKQLLSQLFCPL